MTDGLRFGILGFWGGLIWGSFLFFVFIAIENSERVVVGFILEWNLSIRLNGNLLLTNIWKSEWVVLGLLWFRLNGNLLVFILTKLGKSNWIIVRFLCLLSFWLRLNGNRLVFVLAPIKYSKRVLVLILIVLFWILVYYWFNNGLILAFFATKLRK